MKDTGLKNYFLFPAGCLNMKLNLFFLHPFNLSLPLKSDPMTLTLRPYDMQPWAVTTGLLMEVQQREEKQH